MTAVSKTVSREIETLEAELRMALSDPSVPVGKRTELEERLSAIKAKADTTVPFGGSQVLLPPK
jgi:hypothetical protein